MNLSFFLLSFLFLCSLSAVSPQSPTVLYSTAGKECSQQLSLATSSVTVPPSVCGSSSPNLHLLGNSGYDSTTGYQYTVENTGGSSFALRVSNFSNEQTLVLCPLFAMTNVIAAKTSPSASLTSVFLLTSSAPATPKFAIQNVSISSVNPSCADLGTSTVADLSSYLSLAAAGVLDYDSRTGNLYTAGVGLDNQTLLLLQVSGSSTITPYNLTQAGLNSLLSLKVRTGVAGTVILISTLAGILAFNTSSQILSSVYALPTGQDMSQVFLYETFVDTLFVETLNQSTIFSTQNAVQISQVSVSIRQSTVFYSSFVPSSIVPEQLLYRPCPAGYYCPGRNTSNFILCPQGYYCPLDSPAPLSALGGYFINVTGSSTPFTYQCSTGFYCPPSSISPILCPGGYLCSSSGLVSFGPICNSGSFCPNGSSIPSPCQPGFYCPTAGLSNQTLCPVGSYCPSTNSATFTSCELGYVCPSMGMSQHIPCTAGYYCPSVIGNSSQIVCPPGYYCPTAISSYTSYLCPQSFYCPSGSSQPLNCTMGNYCPSGIPFPIQCTVGHYCPSPLLAAPTPCDSGYSCPTPGLSSEKSCSPNYFCPLTSGNSTQNICPAGWFCPSGQSYPLNCLPGSYSAAGVSSCSPCPAGSYCPSSNTPYPPPPCPPAYHCPNGNSGANGSSDKILCTDAGYYCPGGTADAIVCYSNTTYSSYCEANGNGISTDPPCSMGYVCTDPTHQTPCIAGHYCPAGSTTDNLPCAVGTYCRGQCGACIACVPASNCPEEGAIDPNGQTETSPSSSSSSITNAIVGSCVSGGFTLLVGLLRIYFEWRRKKSEERILGQATEGERHRLKFIKKVIEGVLSRVSTTGFMGLRSDADTKRIFDFIKQTISRIENRGANFGGTHANEDLLETEIVESFYQHLHIQSSCCSWWTIKSLFVPEATPKEFREQSDIIADEVVAKVDAERRKTRLNQEEGGKTNGKISPEHQIQGTEMVSLKSEGGGLGETATEGHVDV